MKFLIPVLLVFLYSCSSELKKPQAPDDLISRDSMVVVMRQLVVLESHIDSKYQNVQNYHKLVKKTGNKLLEDFNISPARFERSYDYYAGHQEKLQSIYTEVLDSLNIEVNKLKAEGVKSESVEGNERNVLQPSEPRL